MARVNHLTPKQIIRSRRESPDRFLKTWSGMCQERFAEAKNPIPVLIRARNEELDLMGCLVALAMNSKEVLPVVVDNASTDSTKEQAEALGAHVLSCTRLGFVPPLQEGVAYIRANFDPCTPVLMTDADCVPGVYWAEGMSRGLINAATEVGAQVNGSFRFYADTNHVAQFLKNVRNEVRTLRDQNAQTGGGNSGYLDPTGQLSDFIFGLSDLAFGEDTAVVRHAQLIGMGRAVLSGDCRMDTRGDRVPSIREYLRCLGSGSASVVSYDRQFEATQKSATA